MTAVGSPAYVVGAAGLDYVAGLGVGNRVVEVGGIIGVGVAGYRAKENEKTPGEDDTTGAHWDE